MERNERYEVNSKGEIVVGNPVTLSASERKAMIEKMFSINGWKYTILQEVTSAHYHIKLENPNLGISKTFHLYHGNVRKEDPERNREEKKIQLGTENDPRNNMYDAILLGFYVYEHKESLSDTIVVAWPIEKEKNYPANPSLRVNMRTDVQIAKNTGYYVDEVSGKNLVVFRPEFIYHYIENYKNLQYSDAPASHTGEHGSASGIVAQSNRLTTGCNVLLYGVPGCGKSHYVEQEYESQITDNQFKVRVVFHPDYTNSDFVGQIMPVLKTEYKDNGEKEEKLKYEFVEGPFTRILMAAEANPTEKCLLIIEELNRGNAPAIFGEVFQLLDRDDDGTSKYAIYNSDIANKVYDNPLHPIRIPSNLTIIATMNTSDQNVFTMDTAFQRRWQMKHIPNKFAGNDLNDATKNHVAKLVPGSSISWGVFATTVNSKMGKASLGFAGTEDKSLGVYFATDKDLDSKDIFAEKVLKYLWDDAFKMGRSELFKEPERSLSYILETFDETEGDALKAVLLDSVYKEMEEKMPTAEKNESVEEAGSVDAEPAEEE